MLRICRNKEKGIEWVLYTKMTCYPVTQNGYTAFYLLPTISYVRNHMCEFDDEHCFDISFKWLFWRLEINRCWGDAYKGI